MENEQMTEIIEENEAPYTLDEAQEGEESEVGESPEDSLTEETSETEETDGVEELRAQKLLLEGEIAALDSLLEQKRAEVDRHAREYAEFKELYPSVELSTLDPEVVASAEAGVPLAAAYALYEKKLAVRAEAAKAHNKATRESGFGSVGKNTASEFFSPDEVRAMSADEVHANYQKILRSMKSWS